MFRFKVKEKTHGVITRVSKILASLGFVGAVVFFAAIGVENYLSANEILADHTVVDADLRFEGISQEKRRKGRVVDIYHFSYQFNNGVDTFAKEFTTSESGSEKYQGKDKVKVAYSNVDPSKFDRLDYLERNRDLPGLLKRLLMSAGGMAFLAFVVHILITRRMFTIKPLSEAAV